MDIHGRRKASSFALKLGLASTRKSKRTSLNQFLESKDFLCFERGLDSAKSHVADERRKRVIRDSYRRGTLYGVGRLTLPLSVSNPIPVAEKVPSTSTRKSRKKETGENKGRAYR